MKKALLSCICFPMMVMAGGYQTNLQSVKAMGMGHCGIAFTGDASALFFNPAQIVRLPSTSGIQAGFTPVFAHTLYQMPGSNYSARTEPNMGTPFNLYAYTGFKKMPALRAGLAVYTPYGSRVQWPEDWKGKFLLREIDLKAIFIQPTLSYAINEQWAVGAGVVLATGGFSLRKAIPLQNSTADYGEGLLEGKGRGMGWQVGIHFKPNKQWQYGLSYRSLVHMRVNEGDAQFQAPVSVASNFPSGKFSAQLPLPANLSYGVMFKPSDKWSLCFDVQGVFWKAYESLNIDFMQETDKLKDIKSARNYKNASIYRFGIQYDWTPRYSVRAGAYIDQTPVQAGYLTPETPDATKLGLTTGISWAVKSNLFIDAAVLFIHGKRRNDTNLETAFSGEYQNKALCAGIGFRWQKQTPKS